VGFRKEHNINVATGKKGLQFHKASWRKGAGWNCGVEGGEARQVDGY
jgi:hypothetical protein